jgi:hypothetical protein
MTKPHHRVTESTEQERENLSALCVSCEKNVDSRPRSEPALDLIGGLGQALRGNDMGLDFRILASVRELVLVAAEGCDG